MYERANERLVRSIARELAVEAMRRIRARLREVEAAPLAMRQYDAERGVEGRNWPTEPMLAEQWVPYLLDDLELTRAEFERCRHCP